VQKRTVADQKRVEKVEAGSPMGDPTADTTGFFGIGIVLMATLSFFTGGNVCFPLVGMSQGRIRSARLCLTEISRLFEHTRLHPSTEYRLRLSLIL
jgi:hypothetical protein